MIFQKQMNNSNGNNFVRTFHAKDGQIHLWLKSIIVPSEIPSNSNDEFL